MDVGTEGVEGTKKDGECITYDAKGIKGGESWRAALCTGTSSVKESDKSITWSTSSSVLTLIIGGVLKASVDDLRGGRIFVDPPI